MFEVQGQYGSATIYANIIEQEAIGQVIQILNQDYMENAHVRIMPDAHAGAGCVIGFTAKVTDKVCPNLIGVDIGCGVLTIELGKIDIDLVQLDKICHELPSGRNTWDWRKYKFSLTDLICYRELKDTGRIEKSLGTLGGGNHFIELNQDADGNKYLVIHSGSRNLGKQVAEYYQKLAQSCCEGLQTYYDQRDLIIRTFKASGRKHLIQEELKRLKTEWQKIASPYPKDLEVIANTPKDEYLHDMQICQEWARQNRAAMGDFILTSLNIKAIDSFETIHNYISADGYIRKGAVEAQAEQKLIIPINMRDGSLICVGKGNPEWNCSAPHGAGRLMSRSKAKENLSMSDYQASMSGIFTTSVLESTLDEAPMAYKPIETILEDIGDTVEVINRITPIYNFKAGE